MFELACTDLRELGTSDERKDDVCGESLLEVRLDAEGVCCVNQDTRVLGCDDRFNDRGDIVDIGECLDAEKNVVVCRFRRLCSFFGSTDNCRKSRVSERIQGDDECIDRPCLGLNLSFPNDDDLGRVRNVCR